MSAGNLIHIRRRVRSVKNLQQIMRAMKFISASRLKKAQERMFAARPYANRMLSVLNSVVTRVADQSHPLLQERKIRNELLIVVTSDKGLCGSFNSNIIRQAMTHLENYSELDYRLLLVGRKGADWFKRRNWPIQSRYVNIMAQVDFRYAEEIASNVIELYESGELDAVRLVYNEFKSVIQQRIVIEPLLPIGRLEVDSDATLDYIYEQPPRQILDSLLPQHVQTQIFRAMLESEAAEHGARMTAMDAATRNAREVIDSLTLTMNRIRQSSITTEIIEIVSGAEALQDSGH